MQAYTAATNTNVVAVLDATATVRYKIQGVHVSYSGTPTNGLLQIKAGDTTIYEISITSAGPAPIYFNPPIAGDIGQDFTFTLAAGGVGITGRINIDSLGG